VNGKKRRVWGEGKRKPLCESSEECSYRFSLPRLEKAETLVPKLIGNNPSRKEPGHKKHWHRRLPSGKGDSFLGASDLIVGVRKQTQRIIVGLEGARTRSLSLWNLSQRTGP